MWRKMLVIQMGGEIEELRSTVEKLRSHAPNSEIVVLCSTGCEQAVIEISAVNQVLVHCAIAETGLSTVPERLLNLIELLKAEQFNIAVIQPHQNVSPYPLAYLCYFAGIPVRIGKSCEFGGGVLSHCLDASEEWTVEELLNRVQEVA